MTDVGDIPSADVKAMHSRVGLRNVRQGEKSQSTMSYTQTNRVRPCPLSSPLVLHDLVRVLTAVPPRPSPPEQPLALHDHPADGSFGISVECKARSDVNHSNNEQFKLELEREVDDVQDEGDRSSRAEQDVCAEPAQNDETQ
jgi:hypothetical protein